MLSNIGKLIYLVLFFNQAILAQGNTDGPYVFYSGDKLVLKHIINNVVKEDISSPGKTNVPVNFSEHSDWDFSVTLGTEEKDQPSSFPGVEKLLVLSDIEGEFSSFRNLLLAAKVTDNHYNWIFGNGHLVICGDLFDRGHEVTQYLWLLYKLEAEARAAGGYVHVILGNHEIMNLSGDLRYVQDGYCEEATLMGKTYGDLYSPTAVLGRWLRTKNIVERVGSLLFLHGGISPEVNALPLSIE